jgi:hypothetical protein
MVLALGYSAYWAFNIRRALAVRLYRNQALGIGLIALSFVFLESGITVFDYISVPSTLFRSLLVSYFYFPLIMAFYWIDTSILAARRSDPLLRDTLNWRRLRIPLWGLNIFFTLLSLSVIIYFRIAMVSVLLSPPLTLVLIAFTPAYITGISGLVYLPITARRSKDPTLRKHLQWFGAFTAFVLLSVLLSLLPSDVLQSIAFNASRFVVAYSLYRSARSLVTLNSLTETTRPT